MTSFHMPGSARSSHSAPEMGRMPITQLPAIPETDPYDLIPDELEDPDQQIQQLSQRLEVRETEYAWLQQDRETLRALLVEVRGYLDPMRPEQRAVAHAIAHAVRESHGLDVGIRPQAARGVVSLATQERWRHPA